MLPLLSPVCAESILARLEPLGMRLTLEPFRRLLAKLDQPQRELPVVLVAGTNGKGSTAALLAAIGCAAGYRTGLYTSPHLEEPRERIRLDGLAIATLELDRLLDAVVAAADDELPTPFEALTAAALLAFAEDGVELARARGRLGAVSTPPTPPSPCSGDRPDRSRPPEHLGRPWRRSAAEKSVVLSPAATLSPGAKSRSRPPRGAGRPRAHCDADARPSRPRRRSDPRRRRRGAAQTLTLRTTAPPSPSAALRASPAATQCQPSRSPLLAAERLAALARPHRRGCHRERRRRLPVAGRLEV